VLERDAEVDVRLLAAPMAFSSTLGSRDPAMPPCGAAFIYLQHF
jgi:hypothetical protein